VTAAELIAVLRKMDPQTPVLVQDSGCGCCSSADAAPLVGVVEDCGESWVLLVHPERKGQVDRLWS
jgi:predicted RNA methylase